MNKQEGPSSIEWRPIPEYEGLYEVSSDGQVRSLQRNTTMGKILAQQLNNSGYLRVNLTRDGRSKYRYVHHLAAYTFIGPRPKGMDVNHKNGLKTDNRAENLEYLSRRENMKHARQMGLHDNRGERHYLAKLTDEQAFQIRVAASCCGISAEEMSDSLDVSVKLIRQILTRKTWKHLE